MALVSPSRVVGVAERLDARGADPVLVAQALDDLARINRLFLGTSLTLRALSDLLADVPAGSGVTLLDAACGGGDVAAAAGRWARRRGLVPRVLAVDASPTIAALAARRVSGEVDVRVGDILGLHLADASVDVAMCSLVLHHFEPDDAVRALRELARVSRRGVVVNDLVRTPLGLAGAHCAALFLTRNPITRHDAVLSARRAYTRGELLQLVVAAGLRPGRLRGALGYRVAIAAKAP
ncbi:MAG: methyltransferase domain-containing protein [Actinomycetota bacterium]|nr:methyltransferase domain-containing protein [Actinomycetota bacterium]